MNTEKKITLATFKKFVNANRANLFIKVKSSFDGMQDMVDYAKNPEFKPVAAPLYAHSTNDLGIGGVWLVGSSGDRFTAFNEGGFSGISVYNCCGSFVVAVKA